jgi:predicted nucleic acid-binding protein
VTIAYVESSALVKLVLAERETNVLRSALRAHDERVTSDLGTVEVTRAAGRVAGHDGVARAREALLSFATIRIDRAITEEAARLERFSLRSLDAIHVATALTVGREDVVFYSYDGRALDAAEAFGLATASPITV